MNMIYYDKNEKKGELPEMELFEYFIFNYARQNEKGAELINAIYESLKDNISEEDRDNFIRAINICLGYTEYKVKEIANETGFSKTKIKFLVKQLIADNKIELFVIENLTFIKPLF